MDNFDEEKRIRSLNKKLFVAIGVLSVLLTLLLEGFIVLTAFAGFIFYREFVYSAPEAVENNAVSYDKVQKTIQGIIPYEIIYGAASRAERAVRREVEKRPKPAPNEAPKLIGVHSMNINVDSEYSPYGLIGRYIFAYDDYDGNLTYAIEVDLNGFDISTPGSYNVTYSVTDSEGLETSESVIYTVGFNIFDKPVLTASDVDALSEGGYFRYEPLPENNYDYAAPLIRPSLVSLSVSDASHTAYGSAFIYKITGDYIYIASVDHVLRPMHTDVLLAFHDETELKLSFEFETLSVLNELSMFKISTAYLPTDTLLSLKEIYVDEYIYDDLRNGDTLITYALYWDRNYDVIKRSKLLELDERHSTYGAGVDVISTTITGFEGMSGTATIDEKGRLAGVICAYDDIT